MCCFLYFICSGSHCFLQFICSSSVASTLLSTLTSRSFHLNLCRPDLKRQEAGSWQRTFRSLRGGACLQEGREYRAGGGEATSSRMGKGKKREKQEDHVLSRTELKARAPSKVDRGGCGENIFERREKTNMALDAKNPETKTLTGSLAQG